MTPKKPSTAQLLRKIELLEARIETLLNIRASECRSFNEYAFRAIDAETRIKQAMRIFTGEDEE